MSQQYAGSVIERLVVGFFQLSDVGVRNKTFPEGGKEMTPNGPLVGFSENGQDANEGAGRQGPSKAQRAGPLIEEKWQDRMEPLKEAISERENIEGDQRDAGGETKGGQDPHGPRVTSIDEAPETRQL